MLSKRPEETTPVQPTENHIPSSLQRLPDLIPQLEGPGPTAASLGLKESIEECMRVESGGGNMLNILYIIVHHLSLIY